MKIPQHVKDKMHELAKMERQKYKLSAEVDTWFIEHGFDIMGLRCVDGLCDLWHDLEDGNDEVVDILCKRIENGEHGDIDELYKQDMIQEQEKPATA